jgi:hypothetical protein
MGESNRRRRVLGAFQGLKGSCFRGKEETGGKQGWMETNKTGDATAKAMSGDGTWKGWNVLDPIKLEASEEEENG